MPHSLLTGAGFSRNWGGWLANEAFEYLLGSPHVDDGLRTLLWRFKDRGGFEAALDEQQTQSNQAFSVAMLGHSTQLEDAIRGMFADMDRAFTLIDGFNFVDSHPDASVTDFLSRFDAIFTLNQDLLMERNYLDDNFSILRHRRGWYMPGMEPVAEPLDTAISEVKEWRPMDPTDAWKFTVDSSRQPYFKLHGSSNWIDRTSGRPMLVIGGNKAGTIAQHKILTWNHDQFKAYLSKPETRLMVIGYSFGDGHINVAIRDAVVKGTLNLFIIDPHGVDVLKENPLAPPGNLPGTLQPQWIGASRRTLREIFGGDMVEHGKVMRFFE